MGMNRRLLLPILLFFTALPGASSAQPAGGAPYLLLSHDPAFLEEIGKVSTVVYSAGRTRLVELTVPPAELPAALAAKIRPVSPAEIYNGPAAAGALKAAEPAVLAVLAKVDPNRDTAQIN